MMQDEMQKVKNLLIFLGTKSGAVTTLPPLQESHPEILGLSEEGGVFLTKTSFTFPGCFFFRMVRPLDLEELDGLITSLPFRFIQDADRMLTVGQILLDVQYFMISPTNRIFEATTELRDMEDIMHIREIFWELKLIREITSLG